MFPAPRSSTVPPAPAPSPVDRRRRVAFSESSVIPRRQVDVCGDAGEQHPVDPVAGKTRTVSRPSALRPTGADRRIPRPLRERRATQRPAAAAGSRATARSPIPPTSIAVRRDTLGVASGRHQRFGDRAGSRPASPGRGAMRSPSESRTTANPPSRSRATIWSSCRALVGPLGSASPVWCPPAGGPAHGRRWRLLVRSTSSLLCEALAGDLSLPVNRVFGLGDEAALVIAVAGYVLVTTGSSHLGPGPAKAGHRGLVGRKSGCDLAVHFEITLSAPWLNVM